jgi:hypothetical protein
MRMLEIVFCICITENDFVKVLLPLKRGAKPFSKNNMAKGKPGTA